MAQTKLSLWNKALDSLGSSSDLIVGDLASPSNRQARLCDRWHDETLRLVQEAAWWPSCRRTIFLDTIQKRWRERGGDGYPEPGYAYSYALPADFLRAWYVTGGVPFSISVNHLRTTSSSSLIYQLSTNARKVSLIYSVLDEGEPQYEENRYPENLNNPFYRLWSTQQFQATYLILAAKIALALEGSPEFAELARQKAEAYLRVAQADMLNREKREWKTIPTWLSARRDGYEDGSRQIIYPFGSAFGEAGGDKSGDWKAYPSGVRRA